MPKWNSRRTMTADEYAEWWVSVDDDLDALPEPTRTLARHVAALQDRLDQLQVACACAYDHPDDRCGPGHAEDHPV